MRVKIKYIDGPRLKRSIIASARRVMQMQDHLNDINVFPVPDGDTGTNMAQTMQVIAEGAERCHDTSFEGVSNAIADSALSGARGNSGVILAQFFQGLAEETRGKVRVSTETFAIAVKNAAERARTAISNPREGTIITVMKDWAVHLTDHANSKSDFVELLQSSLVRAKKSLADTPKKLKILGDSGVVDAGAEGFVHIIEGMIDFIDSGKLVALTAGTHVVDKIRHHHILHSHQNVRFKYCTECLIEGKNIARSLLKEKLNDLGDSLIVIGSHQKVRIHIHTNTPDSVLAIASDCGKVVQKKIEDMQVQVDSNENIVKKEQIALVTDSTCDLPDEFFKKYNINIVPVVVRVGEKNYLDRVEITSSEFYEILKTTDNALSTSQPSLSQYRDMYNKISNQYRSAISLHISESLSGTFNGAQVAAREFKDKINLQILNSKTTSAALGLLVCEAARLIELERPIQEIVDKLKKYIEKTRIYISIPTLKYIIKSGRINPVKGLIGTLLNLKPVLTLDSEGRAVEAKKVVGRRQVVKKTLELAVEYAKTVENPRFSIVHVLSPKVAGWYKEEILKLFNKNDVFIMDASPALGLHTGIGSAAIAVLGD